MKLADDWMDVGKCFQADSAIILLIVKRARWLKWERLNIWETM